MGECARCAALRRDKVNGICPDHPPGIHDPALYTLEQAQAEIQRRECATYGHSWDVIESLRGPIAIQCKCGVRYRVVEEA